MNIFKNMNEEEKEKEKELKKLNIFNKYK